MTGPELEPVRKCDNDDSIKKLKPRFDLQQESFFQL